MNTLGKEYTARTTNYSKQPWRVGRPWRGLHNVRSARAGGLAGRVGRAGLGALDELERRVCRLVGGREVGWVVGGWAAGRPGGRAGGG